MRGLMLDGRRKSIQPMAERLSDGNMQALQQFVNQSPWDWLPVRRGCPSRGPEHGQAGGLSGLRALVGANAWFLSAVSP